jgi:hypothetical protein
LTGIASNTSSHATPQKKFGEKTPVKKEENGGLVRDSMGESNIPFGGAVTLASSDRFWFSGTNK